jgi:hypothetical protein
MRGQLSMWTLIGLRIASSEGNPHMSTITNSDGTSIDYNEWRIQS